jgi:hypothetical protein
MAGEELEIVRLRNDFYQDGFYKLFIACITVFVAVLLLAITSIYLYSNKPSPVTFYTDNDLRVFPPVPVDQPYVKQADLIQWVSEVLPAMFTFDFVNYETQLKQLEQYFTPKGWSALAALQNTYSNMAQIQSAKLFVNASAGGTPTIPNQGKIDGRYGWLVEMPLTIHKSTQVANGIIVKALVIRVPTLNSLLGLAIDDVAVVQQGGVSRSRL